MLNVSIKTWTLLKCSEKFRNEVIVLAKKKVVKKKVVKKKAVKKKVVKKKAVKKKAKKK